MVRRIADLGSLVGGLEQAGATRGGGKRLGDLDRSAARRSGQLGREQGAGDGVSEADLALDHLEQVIERAGVGGELVALRCEPDEADAALGERLR